MSHRTLTTIIAASVCSILIADAAPSLALPEQGNVVQLNGQPWTGRWIRRVESDGQQSLYLQDEWVGSALGVELMDSDRVGQQRVRWFSSPFYSRVTFDRPVQHRFLDIKAIAPQWRTEISGNTLQIFTPDVAVQAIRRSKPEGGDRIVIDLSNRTPWQIQQQGNVTSLILAAELAPSIKPGVNAEKGNLISAVDIQSQSKQTILRIQTTETLQPHIETLADPPRILVDFKRGYVPTGSNILWAEGLRRIERIVALPNSNAKTEKDPKTLRFSVVYLLLDLKHRGVGMRPIWSNPNGMLGTSSLRTIADQWQATAAINGGFFNRDRRLPVGLIREGNRWVAGAVLTRGAIAWNDKGEIFMDRLSFTEEITTSNNQKITLTNLNSGYVQRGVARYTSPWGAVYTPLTENEVLVTVQGDRVVSQYQGGAVGQGQVPIPTNGYVLVVRQSPELVSQLMPGVQLKGRSVTKPTTFNTFANIVGAGPLLLKNGKVVLDAMLEQFRPPFDTQGATRSAIATTKEDGKLILATIHSTPEGILPSLLQTADILKKLGAVDALNLDGGSSSSLFLGGSIIDRDINAVAPIHNAIGIFLSPDAKSDQF
ncbi:phosphodiester glycosidase family protein [Tumidithrix elongata RA019]|uniref:Phosphodiester glycosidase family protein n=1 Tax=Tumidithrix elongata BACA0141 TaxID=2716417 RepID=A0AAW9Q180_9CYAN|nr:phosphodiester glycosidase family protein [Tumidithrix elongata RA019]